MLNELIEKFIRQNESITGFIKDTSDLYQNGQEVIPLFADQLTATHFNPELGNSFAELLLLTDNEALIDQFELTDISKLYESLIELQETNVETFINAAHFEFNIMDDAEKAKKITLAGLNIAKKQVQELESLLKEINEESE